MFHRALSRQPEEASPCHHLHCTRCQSHAHLSRKGFVICAWTFAVEVTEGQQVLTAFTQHAL